MTRMSGDGGARSRTGQVGVGGAAGDLDKTGTGGVRSDRQCEAGHDLDDDGLIGYLHGQGAVRQQRVWSVVVPQSAGEWLDRLADGVVHAQQQGCRDDAEEGGASAVRKNPSGVNVNGIPIAPSSRGRTASAIRESAPCSNTASET